MVDSEDSPDKSLKKSIGAIRKMCKHAVENKNLLLVVRYVPD